MSAPRRPRQSAAWLFRLALRAFPVDFRADHGRAMEQTFHAQHREALQHRDRAGLARLWLDLVRDVCTTAPREHAAILWQDVNYACRALRRARVFAVSAILTLALGMSAMSGMFAIVNAVMFRPLPVDHPEQLISISHRSGSPFGLSFRDLQDYRSESTVLTDAIGYAPRPGALNAGDTTERIGLEVVTDNYFSMLGVEPAIGRLIQPGEGRGRGDAPVMVLAYHYWQARFGGDRSITGRTVRLNGRPFTVIGVAAESFRDTESLVSVAAYIPAWMLDDLTGRPAQSSTLDDRGARTFTVLGRLKPGVSLSEARAALEARASVLARDYPTTHKDVALRVVPETHTRPTPELGSFLRVAATALAGLAALLLLITSANLANLFFARAASRGREVALRTALGARRGRIVRQFLTESVVLALAATVLAIPIAVLAMRSLNQFLASVSAIASIDPDFSLDVPVIATTLAVAMAAGLMSGVGPSLSVCRSNLGDSLKSGGRGATAGSGRFRSALVVAQVALSLALLVSGALFVRSLDRARNVDLGFDPGGIVLARAEPALRGYDAARRLVFYRAVRDLVATLPGVSDAAWISFPPLGITGDIAEIVPDDRPQDPNWRPPIGYEFDVSPEYFATLRVPLVEGRIFDERDDTVETPVVVVNETLARQFWATRSPIGRRLAVDGVTFEIVGVVRDGKYRNVGETPQGAVFKSLAHAQPRAASLVVRSRVAPAQLGAAVRQAISQVDPEVAVYDVRSMTDHLDNGSAFFVYRLGAFITSLFGVMGVLLASIGLYGIVAYHVTQRTQEFGLRMAVGATAGDIIREVLARGGRLALIGVAVGIALAAGLGQVLRGLLLDVSPFDPVTYGGVIGLLITICLAASFLPARRATRVDPLVALRAE